MTGPCWCGCNLPTAKGSHYRWGHGRKGRVFPDQHKPRHEKMVTEASYVTVYNPNHPRARKGRVFEHIDVFEKYHKCCVLRSGSIHHINHNRQDNRIENLQLIGKSAHATLHNIVEDMKERRCCQCGGAETYAYNGGTPQWTKTENGFMCSICYHRKRYKPYHEVVRLRKQIFSTMKVFLKRKEKSERRCSVCGSEKTRLERGRIPHWYHDKNDPSKLICAKCRKG